MLESLCDLKSALVAWLREEQTATPGALGQSTSSDSRPWPLDRVFTGLWHCDELLPEDCWRQFCFANETPRPRSYAYAARFHGGLDLFHAYIDAGNVDAANELFHALMGGDRADDTFQAAFSAPIE